MKRRKKKSRRSQTHNLMRKFGSSLGSALCANAKRFNRKIVDIIALSQVVNFRCGIAKSENLRIFTLTNAQCARGRE